MFFCETTYCSEAKFRFQISVDEAGGKLANQQVWRQNSLGNGKFSELP
jgi:hypothetical protein